MPKKAPSPSDDTAAKAPVRKRRTGRKRKAVREEYISYLISVSGWDYYYAFRPGDPKSRWDQGAYDELATLSFTGKLARPEGTKYDTGQVTFSGRRGLMKEPIERAPASIGSLSASGAELSAYIFIPTERLAELAAVAQSDRIQTIHITGTKLRYRSGLIHHVSVSTQPDEED